MQEDAVEVKLDWCRPTFITNYSRSDCFAWQHEDALIYKRRIALAFLSNLELTTGSGFSLATSSEHSL